MLYSTVQYTYVVFYLNCRLFMNCSTGFVIFNFLNHTTIPLHLKKKLNFYITNQKSYKRTLQRLEKFVVLNRNKYFFSKFDNLIFAILLVFSISRFNPTTKWYTWSTIWGGTVMLSATSANQICASNQTGWANVTSTPKCGNC